jgi:hypothetical protein
MSWVKYVMSPVSSYVECMVPSSGTVFGGGENFRKQGLARGSESLGKCLRRLYLVPSSYISLYFLSAMR